MDTIAQLTSGDEGLVTAAASVHLLWNMSAEHVGSPAGAALQTSDIAGRLYMSILCKLIYLPFRATDPNWVCGPQTGRQEQTIKLTWTKLKLITRVVILKILKS